MKPTLLSARDLIWIAPLSLLLGAGLSFLQSGSWLIGWLGFSFLFLLSFCALTLSVRWAGGGKAIAWMVAAAFILRLAISVMLYLALPVDGYDEPDDNAGFIFTDAHRRDDQAWELASSERPILDAFIQKYAYDQYGGLLAFSALVYRYLSPDVHRPLLLILLSAFMAALGVSFLWKAVTLQWSAKLALAAGWIFVLYPESVLLGGAAMREPYLMTFSAFALWGFVSWRAAAFASRRPLFSTMAWLGLGLLGMALVSPAIAAVTLVILAGWMYFSSERGRVPWWALVAAGVLFVAALFILSVTLNRQGNLGEGTPVGTLRVFLREADKWGQYQLERGSGWVQAIFSDIPEWLRLPFVAVYGIFQPVLPAALVEPTTLTWRIIAILRAAGWYTLLPLLVFSLVAGASAGVGRDRKVWVWLSLLAWGWILFASLRAGGDQWDNPRYRAILFLWQALLAGQAIVWWRETRNPWFTRVLLGEAAFLAVFSQWYASRYFHWGGRLSFGGTVLLILVLWALIGAVGWAWDRRRRA